jgi:hypothetical protein
VLSSVLKNVGTNIYKGRKFNPLADALFMKPNERRAYSYDEATSVNIICGFICKMICGFFTETDVPVSTYGKPDFVIKMKSDILVVSTTRGFKTFGPYNKKEALRLMTKKLNGLRRVIDMEVVNTIPNLNTDGHKIIPVLHVLCPTMKNLKTTLRVLKELSPGVKVLCTLVSDSRVYVS